MGKRISCSIYLLLIPVLFIIAQTKPSRDLDTLIDVELNGTIQKIQIQSNDLNHPILLWLHGGPGGTAMLMSHYYTDSLKNHFTIVNWDQRGAGLSYHKDIDTTTISEEQIILDALELTKQLTKKYNKKKIFILGHSFGSVIGMHLAERYPDYYHAYIGMGQVVDFKQSVKVVYNWLSDTLKSIGDNEELAKIQKTGMPNIWLVRKFGGEMHTKIDKKEVIKNSPLYYEGYMDDRFRGLGFTRKYMNKYANSIPKPVSEIKRLSIPVYFFIGKYDHVPACANEVIQDYFSILQAPKKKLILFEESAHFPNLEEPDKFQLELIKILRKIDTRNNEISTESSGADLADYFNNWVYKTSETEKPHIAFSFDDGSTRDRFRYKALEWNSMIRKQLKDNHIQAVWFVAGRSMDSDEGRHLLQKWDDEGHIIANHTYSHFNYNDSSMTCKAYIEDIQKCDSLICSFKNYRRIFRFPYLNGGNTISKRDSLNDFLQQNDYKQGWVSIDNAEWYINMRLMNHLKENPDADISVFKDYYVNNMFEMAEFYNMLSIQNNHRQIKHTLLLHFNLTSALFLNDLIEKFRNEGWTIDNYSEAIKDTIYSEHLIGVPAEQSLIWMQEMQREGFVSRYHGEDSKYLEEEMDKLGL